MRLRLGLIACVMCVLLTAKGWAQDEEPRWNKSTSTHFVVYYKDAPAGFAESVQESAERYYDEITRNLGFTRYKGWTFDDRARIYIYADKDDYIKGSQQANWSSAVALYRHKVIKTYPSAYGFFDTTLPHELGHIIFREFVGTRAFLPVWLDEGVAMYQEKAKRWGANGAVRKAIEDGTFIPLQELNEMRLTRSMSRQEINLFYSEAASIVYYMITELGESRFVKFCRRLKDGDSFQRSFEKTYGRFKSLEDLNKAWVDYLKRKH